MRETLTALLVALAFPPAVLLLVVVVLASLVAFAVAVLAAIWWLLDLVEWLVVRFRTPPGYETGQDEVSFPTGEPEIALDEP